VDLRRLASVLGGEVLGQGILCPGPGHSPHDRSLSVLFKPDGSVVVNSFAGQEWKECLDHVLSLVGQRDIIARQMLPSRLSPFADSSKKLARAKHYWSCGRSDPLPPKYLQFRGLSGAVPGTVKFLAAGVYPHPAVICAFGMATEPKPSVVAIDDDAVAGIHLTFLKPDGRGKASIDAPKITLGPSRGTPIVVAHPGDGLGLAITEGVEDAITVHEVTGLGAWAAGCANRLPCLADKVPDHIEAVTIFAHNDDAGMNGANALAALLLERSIEVRIDVGEHDINDVLRKDGADAVRRRADRARAFS
jgi:hypothetical protein